MPKSPRRRIALDFDTALEDGQWAKLKEFLTGKVSDDDLETVEEICRGGGDAQEAKPKAGAEDSARRSAPKPPPVDAVRYTRETFPHAGRLK